MSSNNAQQHLEHIVCAFRIELKAGNWGDCAEFLSLDKKISFFFFNCVEGIS